MIRREMARARDVGLLSVMVFDSKSNYCEIRKCRNDQSKSQKIIYLQRNQTNQADGNVLRILTLSTDLSPRTQCILGGGDPITSHSNSTVLPTCGRILIGFTLTHSLISTKAVSLEIVLSGSSIARPFTLHANRANKLK